MAMSIDYGNLMHQALRGLIETVLRGVEKDGLPGQHHFFITFDTRHPDARLADWLRERYPDDMTIVMQHWFDRLKVDTEGFAVTLNFGEQPEPLYIPFDAIRTFVDPSVEFGLRFETQGPDDGGEAAEAAAGGPGPGAGASPGAAETERSEQRPDAEVVSLDKWRK